jgi:hypothetical protein
MPREEKKLQIKFQKSLNSKYLTNPNAAEKTFIVNGISGSTKFARWIYEAKNNSKSVDFAFIGDSNCLAGNGNEANYGPNLTIGDINYRTGSYGYMTGLAYALQNNNVNMYGGPIECFTSSVWKNPALVSSIYNGGVTATLSGTNTVTLTSPDTTIGLTAGMNLTKISGSAAFGGSANIASVSADGITFTTNVNHATTGSLNFYAGSSTTLPEANTNNYGVGASYHTSSGPYNYDCITDFALNAGTNSVPQAYVKIKVNNDDRKSPTNFYYGYSKAGAAGAAIKSTKNIFNKMHGFFAREIFGESCYNSFSSGFGNLNIRYPNQVPSSTNNEAKNNFTFCYIGGEYNYTGGELNFTYRVTKGNSLFDNKQHIFRVLAWESTESTGYFPMSLYYYASANAPWNPKTRYWPTSATNFQKYDAGLGTTDAQQIIRSGMKKIKGTLKIIPSESKAYFIIKDVWNNATNAFDKRFNQNVGSSTITRFDHIYLRSSAFLKITNKNSGDFKVRATGLDSQNIDGFYIGDNANNGTTIGVSITTTRDQTAGTITAGTEIILNDASWLDFARHLITADINYRTELVSQTRTNGFTVPVNTIITAISAANKSITLSNNIVANGTFSNGTLQIRSNILRSIPFADTLLFTNLAGTAITTEQTYNDVEAEIASLDAIRVLSYPTRSAKSTSAFTNNLIYNSDNIEFNSTTNPYWTSSIEITLNKNVSSLPEGQSGSGWTVTKGSGGSGSKQIMYTCTTPDYLSSSFNSIYFASVSDGTFSIWVKPLSTGGTNSNIINIGLYRDNGNLALPKSDNGTTVTTHSQGWTLDGTTAGSPDTSSDVVETTTCRIEEDNNPSATKANISVTANGGSINSTIGNYIIENGINALWKITFNSSALDKWHRIQISRTGFFTSVRIYPGVLNDTTNTNTMELYGPQIETNSVAGSYKQTTGNRILSNGSWKPIEVTYNLKTEAEGGVIKNDVVPDVYDYSVLFWGSGAFKGPLALAMQSVYTKTMGFAITGLHVNSGGKIYDNTGTKLGFLDAIKEITPQGSNSNNTTLRTILTEYRSRQLSASNNKSGRVCVIVQGGINDVGALTSASTIKSTVKELILLLHSEWKNGCGFPEEDFNVVIMPSHQRLSNTDSTTTLLNEYKTAIKELITDTDCIDKFTFVDISDFVTYQQIIDNNYFDYTLNAHCNAGRAISYNPSVGHVHLHSTGYKAVMNAIISKILAN